MSSDAQTGLRASASIQNRDADAPILQGLASDESDAQRIHLPLSVLGMSRAELPLPRIDEPVEELSYWRDAYPIIQQECVSCHYVGGIGPFPLQTYRDVSAEAGMMRYMLEEELMPPLPADPESGLPFDDPRIMSDEDRETLVAWIEAGMPEGDPAQAPELPPVDHAPYGEPDIVLDIGSDYQPTGEDLDDYRCFVIDPGFDRDTEIRMVDLLPTADPMFHHGILYLAEPDQVDTAMRLDAAEEGPGYSCFGGPGFNSSDWVAMEAVGSPALPYPAGTAKVIPAGSRFVLQLHYNTLNGLHVDRSQVRIWLPESRIGREPQDHEIAQFLFALPPGQRENQVDVELDIVEGGGRGALRGRVLESGLLWRVWGHMHMLGTHFRFDLIKPDGREIRVLDIPRWDFDWQGAYDLIDPVALEPGDRLRMTCGWDNSPENQPYVEGRQVEPRWVTWGAGTLDEMCLGGVTLTPMEN